MSSAAGKSQVYQMKISLKKIKPPIWRRVLAPADITLHKLHEIIQIVMGWSDTHLHVFSIRGKKYEPPDPDQMEASINSKKTKLNQVAGEKDHFLYTYDFGDDWQHEIRVEKILPAEPGRRYPLCLAGARSVPPEDSGGPYSYDEFLEKWIDAKHPEHEETREWAGEYYNPEEFDLEFVNKDMKALK